jgi:3-hydroxyacyl-[acyl-carrier-protein] dehydratase
MPGVLLAEAAAQLAGTVAQSDPHLEALPDLKLASLRAVKFLGVVHPGELIRLEARITGRLGNLVQAEATASIAGRVVMQAAITLAGGSE